MDYDKNLTTSNIFKAVALSQLRYVVFLYGCLLIGGCGEEPVPHDPLPRSIYTMRIQAKNQVETRLLSGVTHSVDDAELSFEISGRISAIHVDEGDDVVQNQLLAELDKDAFHFRHQRQQAELAEAEAELVRQQQDYQRKKVLLPAGAVSHREYEASKAAWQAGLNQVKQLKSQLALASKDLSDTELRAPYDGRISARYLEPFQQVQTGTPILHIQNPTALEVRIAIPETLVDSVERGSENHQVSFPSQPAIQLSATLTELATEVTQAGSYPARLTLNNVPANLRAGMTADVQLQLHGHLAEDQTQLLIPWTAVLAEAQDNYAVFLYKADDQTVERRSIQIAEIKDGQASVSDGLNEGDSIVTQGAGFLQNGEKVRLIGQGVNWYQE